MVNVVEFLKHAKASIQSARKGHVTDSRTQSEGGAKQISLNLSDMGFHDMKSDYDKAKRVLHIRGRENYYELIFALFQKMKKHNLVLVGNSGVGKEAIIEGIAERIAKGKVPDFLKGKEMWKLDLDIFITGDYIQAGIPERMEILHDVLANMGNVILYLYPMYVIPEYKILNDLAEAIKGTNTLVVGSLTTEDYNENISLLDGNDAVDTVEIISVVAPELEEIHNVLKFKLRELSRFYGVKISKKAFDKCLNEVYRLNLRNIDLDVLLDYIDATLAFAKNAGKTELDYQSIYMAQKFALLELFKIPEKERFKLSMHEADHAVVGFSLNRPPETVTIIPGSFYLGINMFENPNRPLTSDECVELIAIYLAPIASAELRGEVQNTASGGDYSLATNRARNMVLYSCMRRKDDSLGRYQCFAEGEALLISTMTEMQKTDLSKKVDEILKDGVELAKQILSEEKGKMAQQRIAEALFQNASLTAQEAKDLFEGKISVADLENANISEIVK